MRISEIRDDFKMELSYTKMRVLVQGAGEGDGEEFVTQALLANQGGSKQLGLWNQIQLDHKFSFVMKRSVMSGTPVSFRIGTTKQKLLSVFQLKGVIMQIFRCLYDCWKGWRNKGQGKPLLALRFTASFQKLLQISKEGTTGDCHQLSQLPAASGRVIS